MGQSKSSGTVAGAASVMGPDACPDSFMHAAVLLFQSSSVLRMFWYGWRTQALWHVQVHSAVQCCTPCYCDL